MRTSESRLGILAKQYIDLEQRWYYAALIDSRSPRLCNLHFDIIVGLSPLTGLMALLGLFRLCNQRLLRSFRLSLHLQRRYIMLRNLLALLVAGLPVAPHRLTLRPRIKQNRSQLG